MDNKTIALSGGFDPVHVGHLRMIKAASEIGRVVIILNSDDWLMRKKGYVFMTFEERKELLKAFNEVKEVIEVNDIDNTVCQALDRIRPHYFGNGGDRKSDNVPEVNLCVKLGIELAWNLGGDKIQSSSDLVNSMVEHMEKP